MLISLLRQAAEDVPNQPVVVADSGSTTYTECLERSELLAAGLQSRGLDRFACIVDDVADLIALLCASTATGAEACVYSRTLTPDAVSSLAERFDHATVVTDREPPSELVGALLLSDLLRNAAGSAQLPPPPTTPALILTTGTTGQPKGARHDWSRLASAVRLDPSQRGARWLLAYNLNQFAGVQVLLHVLANQATLVVPASNQPGAALKAMREHGVTHASATPTFWRFVTAMTEADDAASLGLQQITLGGEATPRPLLAQLGKLFPNAKISQVYASTESGSTVSVRDTDNGLPASVLARSTDSEAQMKIVDGELHIHSRVGMLGYYGEPDLEDWRATGDLVELRGDRIHFVGRSTDIINVGGVKVHPLPVEEVVAGVDGVQLVRAYGRPNALTGNIVVIDVVARAGTDEDALKAAIRAACGVLPSAAQPRRIQFVTELATDGNKLVRR